MQGVAALSSSTPCRTLPVWLAKVGRERPPLTPARISATIRLQGKEHDERNEMAVAVRGVNCGTVVLTMNRVQAQACYDALMTEPLREYSAQECAECFLIVQLADALGLDVCKSIRDRADVVA